jgi:hypothetical protein
MYGEKDVVSYREMLDEFKLLEDESYSRQPEGCAHGVSQGTDLDAVHADNSPGRVQNPGGQIEEGGLSATTGPDDRGCLCRLAGEVVDPQAIVALRILEFDLFDLEHGSIGGGC